MSPFAVPVIAGLIAVAILCIFVPPNEEAIKLLLFLTGIFMFMGLITWLL